MSESKILVEVKDLHKSFGPLKVMDGLDFTLSQGENVAILGQSGTGKSVLLKVIIGLLDPDEGEVALWGRPIAELDEVELNSLRRKMGMVFQSGALFDSMTVYENLAFPLVETGVTDEKRSAPWSGSALNGSTSPEPRTNIPRSFPAECASG